MFFLRSAQAQPLVRAGLRFSHRIPKTPQQLAKEEAKKASKKNERILVQRDAQGRPIFVPREKSIGTYQPLPEAGLTHELFETDGPGRVGLDIQTMTPRLLSPGAVTRFHDTDPTSPMRVYGVPKHMLLEFRILGVPASVTTSTTLSLVRALEESKENPARLVLNGRPGCGKSFLLLQTAEYAAATGEWIVLYVPRTKRFVDGSTPFAYSLATRIYLQPRAARETLQRFGTVNAHLLKFLQTTEPIQLEGKTLPEATPLLEVVAAGKNDESHAVMALEAIMREVTSQALFPVLIAVDDFQSLTGHSMYRDPRFRMLRPHHLSMPRLLLEYASGRKPLASGLVLGALCRSDTQFPVSKQLSTSLSLPVDFMPSPRSGRERRSSQLAWYLENEVEPLEFEDGASGTKKDEHDADEEDLEASSETAASVDASEATASPSDAERESEGESGDASELDKAPLQPEWTGWRVFDPPAYEDAVVPTYANPFPAAHPANATSATNEPANYKYGKPRSLADEMSLRGEEDGAEVEEDGDELKGMRRDEEDLEEGEDNEASKQRQAADSRGMRALRAVRVPDALSIREAAALFEVWLDSGVIRTGGERRVTRRAELETLEEWRQTQAEVAADPEMESTLTPDSPELAKFKADHPQAAFDSDSESDNEDDPGLTPEYRGARALERAVAVEDWAAYNAATDMSTTSLDAAFAQPEPASAVEEDVDGVVEEDMAPIASEDSLAEDADASELTAAEEDALAEEPELVPDEQDADAEELTANEDSEIDTDAEDSDAEAGGVDPDIAATLSVGLRAALADPEAMESLTRAPLMPTFVSRESGADTLFLGKYAESSGNARAFVWGGLLATLQSST